MENRDDQLDQEIEEYLEQEGQCSEYLMDLMVEWLGVVQLHLL